MGGRVDGRGGVGEIDPDEPEDEDDGDGGPLTESSVARKSWTSSAVFGSNLRPKFLCAHLMATSSGANMSPPSRLSLFLSEMRTSS